MKHLYASVSPRSDLDSFSFRRQFLFRRQSWFSRLVCVAAREANPSPGLFLLHAPNGKHSILIIPGFCSTSARWERRYPLEAGKDQQAESLVRKFIRFRFRASALPSWASFPLQDGIGIGTIMEELGRFGGKPKAQK
jgi:hypothetical protein